MHLHPWIAYVGPFHFPWGDAVARRVFGVAGALAMSGHQVVIAGGGLQPTSRTRLEGMDWIGSVSYLGLGEAPEAGATLSAKARQVTRWGRRTVDWLDAQPTRPSYVLVHGGAAQYAARLRQWCHSNRIPLVADVVDWYGQRQVRAGALGTLQAGAKVVTGRLGLLSAKVALHYHYPRCAGILAISSLLEEHYRSRGCRVLRVPPTLDVEKIQIEPRHPDGDGSPLRLVYAGFPGRKDLLADIVRTVDELGRAGADLELSVCGPSRDLVADLGRGQLPSNVRFLGRLHQLDAARTVQQADFSVILRRPEYFVHAGFPTKFCESLANGTPVITNLTSDLGYYLRNGIEGLVCADHSVEALRSTLQTALQLGRKERGLMRDASRQQALKSFDFRRYAQTLGEFLSTVRA